MNTNLKHDRQHVSAILERAKEVADKYFREQDAFPAGRFISDIAMEDLPEKGIGALEVLEQFESRFAPFMTNSAGPRYFGFVTGGSTPAAVAGDWMVSAFDQNACGSNDSIAPQLERQTIHFFQQLFGLNKSFFGSFVTGATISNFVGLSLARQWVGEQFGIDFSNEGLSSAVRVRVLSATPHSSILKSLAMTGLGRNALIKIDTLPDREAIDMTALEKYLAANPGPLIIVANAGTVNTVDFDDLQALARLKEKYKFWLHVDAAFGGFAACSDKFSHLVTGMDAADSVTIDAHKWLNVPYDAAMQFTRHKNIQLKVFQNSAAYLGDPERSPDYFHYTPENSRRFRALPSWFTLMAYGKEGYREIVERNCSLAAYFGEQLQRSGHFRLLAQVRMNVVCFTLEDQHVTMDQITRFLAAVRDDGNVFFTPTIYKGVPAIRAAISNWQTESTDMDAALEVLIRLVHQQRLVLNE